MNVSNEKDKPPQAKMKIDLAPVQWHRCCVDVPPEVDYEVAEALMRAGRADETWGFERSNPPPIAVRVTVR
jgi:hypothetical protein